MRIASFNMRGGGSHRHWSEILTAVDPDILLVQECRDPSVLASGLERPVDVAGAIWEPVAHGRWGSALLVRGTEVRQIPVPGFSGWVVGGACQVLGEALHIFSVHLPPDGGSYVRAANLALDALRPITAGSPVILGGDWNLTVSRGNPQAPLANRAGELELLARLEADFGVRSAWDVANPDEPLPQTLRWAPNPVTPYHCDGVFLSQVFAECVTSVTVLCGSPWVELSDHNPVVVEITSP